MGLVNKEPVSYLQTDPRWKNIPYAVKGESSTIGGSGCGPTAMAMVIATWADPSVTPKSECAWALNHKPSFKALNQGTYYSYFVPAAERFGLECRQLTAGSIYGNANSPCHGEAKKALDRGDFVIACMGKGTWTSSGHFVLVWGVEGNTVYINDPASTKLIRTRGNYLVFKQQVKHYWVIKRPKSRPLEEVKFAPADWNVKVLDREGLNCRKGPGLSHEVMTVYPYETVVSLTETSSDGWGRTDKGWIFLRNTERTEDMTKQETEKLVEEILRRELDAMESRLAEKLFAILDRFLPVVYDTEKEIPEWYRDAFEKVRLVLKGRAEGKLGLSEELLRVLTLLDRMGVLGRNGALYPDGE